MGVAPSKSRKVCHLSSYPDWLLILRSISHQRRKANTKPRDASNPTGSTAAESVRNLIKKNPRYSKRINYEALKELFLDGSSFVSHAVNSNERKEEKKEELLFEMEEMVVLEEEGGGVGLLKNKSMDAIMEADEDAEGEDDMGDGFGAGGWDDFYEQEV